MVAGFGPIALHFPKYCSITARAASCDDSACYLARQDWGVPVRIGDGGAAALDLVLRE